jgi:O-antigen/teichoic acid export membrane protein
MSEDVANRNSMVAAATLSPLRNGLFNLGGYVLRGAITVLTIPFLIRFLGISEYGVWSFAYAFLALMTVCEAGLSVAAAVFLSKDLAQNNKREAGETLTFILISSTLLSVALSLLLWFAGPLLARPLTSFGSAERAVAGQALRIAGFAAAILILQRTLVGVEQAFNRYAVSNALDLAQSMLTNVGFLAVARWSGRTVALMQWQVVASVLVLTAHACFVAHLFRNHELRFEWNRRKGRQILRFSLAAWSATLGSAAFSQCDRLIVGGVLGAPLLGVYSAIVGITSKINLFSGTAVQPLVQWLSRDTAMNTSTESRIGQAVHLNALLAIESGIFLFVLADWVMRVMIPGASGSHEILGLQIATVIYVLYSLNAPGHFILFAVGQPRTNAIVTVSGAIASLALIFVGAKYVGLLGALAGNAGYLLLFVLTTAGLKILGIAFRKYVGWIALPVLGLGIAIVLGLLLQEHFWWRVGFVATQAVVFSFWFLHSHADTHSLRFDFGRVSQS